MKATVVVDNRKNGALSGEWGLCIYIEHGEKRILLDTGASSLFAANAAQLGLDLGSVDAAVLSHAHYDHANGMETFFRCNDKAKFYVGRTCAADCYAKYWLFRRYIGVPKTVLQAFRERVIYAPEQPVEILTGAYLVPHSTPELERVGRRERMYRLENGRWRPDDFSHEQSLVLDTVKGLVIFNSCSHGGAANIINEVAAAFPDKTVYALIGGFHLYKPASEVRALAEKIRQTGVAYVCTGHCTGERAYRVLREELGDRLHQLQVGKVMEF